ncbi:MAG: hypothetical protein GAK45_00116 [Pseudomonas citronellolis]|nr:MAG: hypothetical protein GAK45_00116 [Pseudomonas citronellolis]
MERQASNALQRTDQAYHMELFDAWERELLRLVRRLQASQRATLLRMLHGMEQLDASKT